MSVIAEWIGNSESVARKHYLGVTDQDFQRAQDLNPFTSIVRQVVQHQAAPACTDDKADLILQEKRPLAASCTCVQSSANGLSSPVGLEEGQQSSGETTIPVNHCAPPGAQDLNPEQLAAQLRDLDRSELEQLLLTPAQPSRVRFRVNGKRWPTLSKAVQQQIMLLVG